MYVTAHEMTGMASRGSAEDAGSGVLPSVALGSSELGQSVPASSARQVVPGAIGSPGTPDELRQSLDPSVAASKELGQLVGGQVDAGDFESLVVDSALFIKLLADCEFHLAEATVLWDLIEFHKSYRMDAHATRSAAKLSKTYPTMSPRSLSQAITDLEGAGLIDIAPDVKNVSKRIRLVWPALAEQLAMVNPKTPGLPGPQCQ